MLRGLEDCVLSAILNFIGFTTCCCESIGLVPHIFIHSVQFLPGIERYE